MVPLAGSDKYEQNPETPVNSKAARVRQQCPYHPIAVAAGAFVWSYRALFSCV